MASQFLTSLSNQIGNQFGGQNENRSLDVASDGTSSRYGQLGDFAKQIDQTQTRSYLQEGYLRYDQFNAAPKNLEILFQEPEITVLVKKRAFNSLADNYQLNHMSNDEKLFYKATKILFANKAMQIATFERLSKIQRISASTGRIADQLMPLVISLVENYQSTFSGFTPNNLISPATSSSADSGISHLASTLKTVKDVYAFSSSNFYTSWVTDTTNIFPTQLGQGTGVLEFCNVTDLNTTASLEFGGGNINLNITDPYNLMVITTYDIEKALSDATNVVYNNQYYQFGQDSIDTAIAATTQQLNALRANRGASAIQFMTDPTTVFGQRVTAIITGLGDSVNFTYNAAAGLAGIAPGLGGVTVSPEFLINATDPGYEGINTANGSNSELSLFCTIIDNYYAKLQSLSGAQSITQQNSALTNYARKKLRLHYGGKLCIQPMDQVHVYMGSKTRLDNKVNGGLQSNYTGLNFLQKLNNTAADFRNQFDSLFNPNGNANFQLEKNIYAGSTFPNWLWTIMRSMFVDETSGVHTFGGVVTGASSTYNQGVYTAAIDGKDMTHYLEKGRVNFKPSIDVFNGPLYDPLTPFKSSFDSVTSNFSGNQLDLLDENKAILAENIVKFKNGHLSGQPTTESNLKNNDAEHQHIGSVQQVFYAPDGLVYKWREGIGTYTHLSNSTIIPGDNTVGSPNLAKDAFSGQDIMNVISLSITGQPYNYSNFYKAAQQINGFGRDPQTGKDSAFSYYKSLTRDLVKNNVLWGNFVPFKSLFMDEATYQNILNGQFTIQNGNDQVNQQLQQLSSLTNALQQASKNVKNATGNTQIANLTQAIKSQSLTLTNQLSQMYNQLANNSGTQGLSIVGNDVSFDYDSALNTGGSSSLTNPSDRKNLRRKVNMLTRRMSWQVRANEDKNLFIVDDSYDKDYDIQAFEKSLGGDISVYDSEFTTVSEKVNSVAKLLDLEVYCDTQGHIRCRPPQYNRMPSSVFYRLFQLKQATGVQIYPKFLENLFLTQLSSLQKNFEVIEDLIRLDCCLLGAATDDQCYTIIRSNSATQFLFLTDESSGTLTSFAQLDTLANPDSEQNNQNNSIADALSLISSESQLFNAQAGITNIFNSLNQATLFITSVVDPTVANTFVATQADQTRKTTLVNRIQLKTGQQVNVDQFSTDTTNSSSTGTTGSTTPDTLKVINDLATKINSRQTIIKQLAKAIQNTQESVSLDSTTGQQTANSLLAPNITQNSSIPEVFESMIEDETYDDIGPNSGKRYIIEEYQILNFNISERPPTFTAIEVNGILGDFIDTNLAPDTGKFLGGGNSLVSAAAVDYDMWRMYGFITTSSLHTPFLSDPEGQMAPYAATILNRARQDILGGSITIVGNEYMQPGDVVYLRSRDLLFYATSVSQAFNYDSSSFQTTLQLRYGHPAGEYIPITLDVIGKMLYNNRSDTSYVNRRQGNSYNQESVGIIMLDNRTSTTDINTMLFQGTYGDANAKVLNDILYTTYYAIESNNDPSTGVQAAVEVRVYANSQTNYPVNSTLLSAAETIKDVLVGNFTPPNTTSPIGKNQTLSSDSVTVATVDLSTAGEYRSPSQSAIDMSRNISSSNSNSANNNTPISTSLFGYIIDVWVTFTNTSTTDS